MSVANPGATIRYTAMRIVIFMGSLVFCAVLVHFGIIPKGLGGSNFIWTILLALVISAPLSFVLLRKQRDKMSEQLINKVDRAKVRLEASRTQEDGLTQ
ncbi:DUF4229 domain-containing protein [Streptomyces sp. NPDC006649]|uniref:DUF4229 domain-containing protein n=2 Tax=Streptomyces TaxID=1883 RepID=UPI0032470586